MNLYCSCSTRVAAFFATAVLLSGCQSASLVTRQTRPPSVATRHAARSVSREDPLRDEADRPSHSTLSRPSVSRSASSGYQPASTAGERNSASAENTGRASSSDIQKVADLSESGFTLPELESLALQHNPSLRQASAAIGKSVGVRKQVGAYPNPNIGYNGSQIADRHTEQHTLFVEQDLVTGQKLSANVAVVDQDIRSMEWEAEAQRVRVISDVRQAFYELLAQQQQYELSKEFVKIAEQGVKVTQKLVAGGDGSRVDLLQSEIQLNEVTMVNRRMRARRNGTARKLAALIGLPELPLEQIDGELPETAEHRDWDVVVQGILSDSPEVQSASARVDRAQAIWNRESIQAIPNVSLYVGAGKDQGTDSGFLNTQVSVPLPLFNRNEGNISAAESEYCRAIHDLERIQMSLKARLATAAQTYDAAAASVEQYQKEIIPRTRETRQLSEKAYELGEISFLQVLTVRKTYFDAQLAYLQARGELAQANALIENLLLTGGLDNTPDSTIDDGLRGKSLTGQ